MCFFSVDENRKRFGYHENSISRILLLSVNVAAISPKIVSNTHIARVCSVIARMMLILIRSKTSSAIIRSLSQNKRFSLFLRRTRSSCNCFLLSNSAAVKGFLRRCFRFVLIFSPLMLFKIHYSAIMDSRYLY